VSTGMGMGMEFLALMCEWSFRKVPSLVPHSRMSAIITCPPSCSKLFMKLPGFTGSGNWVPSIRVYQVSACRQSVDIGAKGLPNRF